MNADDDVAALAASARLFGRLLVRELDPATLRGLQQTEVREALGAVGVEVPDAADADELAHAWLACFLHPDDGPPPVQSLVRDGKYDGDPAAAVRALAKAAGLELAAGARNAPPDHIGCILLLWAELATTRPELVARITDQHLDWAVPVLHATASRRDLPFYPQLAAATIHLLRGLRAFPLACNPPDNEP